MIHLLASNTKLTGVDKDMVQPDAVDLRVGTIYKVSGKCVLLENSKEHAEHTLVTPNENGRYVLESGYYTVEFAHNVKMGENEAGLVIPRSTLMRNGVQLETAVYDSGYVGKMISAIYVAPDCTFEFEKNARLAQFILFNVKGVQHLYNGSYQESLNCFDNLEK